MEENALLSSIEENKRKIELTQDNFQRKRQKVEDENSMQIEDEVDQKIEVEDIADKSILSSNKLSISTYLSSFNLSYICYNCLNQIYINDNIKNIDNIQINEQNIQDNKQTIVHDNVQSTKLNFQIQKAKLLCSTCFDTYENEIVLQSNKITDLDKCINKLKYDNLKMQKLYMGIKYKMIENLPLMIYEYLIEFINNDYTNKLSEEELYRLSYLLKDAKNKIKNKLEITNNLKDENQMKDSSVD